MFLGNTSVQLYHSYQGASSLPPPPNVYTQPPPGYNEIAKRFYNQERSQNSLEKVMRTMTEQWSLLVTVKREKEILSSQTEPNPNVGSSSMCPPVQDNVKRVNVITSLSSGYLIDHNLEDVVDVPIQFSPSLSPPSLPENDSTSRDATEGTPIGSLPSPLTNLVDPRKTKQKESKKGNDISQPLNVKRIHKLVAPFSNRLRNKKDQTHVVKIRETY